ncbi:MAG: SDR family oxidoreductase [Isosphaeraceae bacterium]
MADSRRAVLVTGAGRGLGRAIAEELASRGSAVGLVSRTESQLAAVVATIRQVGGSALPLVGDVTDRSSLRDVVAKFHEWAGKIDALVCAAARLTSIGPFGESDPDAWWADLETSIRGVENSVRETLPILGTADEPSITVLVGPGHQGPLPYATGYGIAQAALVRFVESLALELASGPVGVFAVNPGLVATSLIRGVIDSADGRRWLPRFNEAFAEGKEFGPEVVAEMVAWLVERRPRELSGRVVPAAQTPELVEMRLGRIVEGNLGVLRLR